MGIFDCNAVCVEWPLKKSRAETPTPIQYRGKLAQVERIILGGESSQLCVSNKVRGNVCNKCLGKTVVEFILNSMAFLRPLLPGSKRDCHATNRILSQCSGSQVKGHKKASGLGLNTNTNSIANKKINIKKYRNRLKIHTEWYNNDKIYILTNWK